MWALFPFLEANQDEKVIMVVLNARLAWKYLKKKMVPFKFA